MMYYFLVMAQVIILIMNIQVIFKNKTKFCKILVQNSQQLKTLYSKAFECIKNAYEEQCTLISMVSQKNDKIW